MGVDNNQVEMGAGGGDNQLVGRCGHVALVAVRVGRAEHTRKVDWRHAAINLATGKVDPVFVCDGFVRVGPAGRGGVVGGGQVSSGKPQVVDDVGLAAVHVHMQH